MTEELLTAAEILEADDIAFKDVPCPEWGGTPENPRCVRVKDIGGAARDMYERSLVEEKQGKVKKGESGVTLVMDNARAKLVALAACDADLQPIFTPDQVALLGKKSAKALDRCFTVAQELCGISDEDLEELVNKAGEELGKGPGDSTSPGSPLALDDSPTSSSEEHQIDA